MNNIIITPKVNIYSIKEKIQFNINKIYTAVLFDGIKKYYTLKDGKYVMTSQSKRYTGTVVYYHIISDDNVKELVSLEWVKENFELKLALI
jgi:hypothetical protein